MRFGTFQPVKTNSTGNTGESMQLPRQQLRCIFCGENNLSECSDRTACQSCGHHYPKFNEVTFLGSYRSEDALGLMEVTSKISTNVNPEAMRANREKSERELKRQFEEQFGDPNVKYQQDELGSQAMAMSVRLREWGAFELLAKEIDFQGKLCFDNGAGLGSDSLRLIDRGADVVCLDFNPISVENGMRVVPEADWICGNSEYLPFVDNTFDVSVANAALHHMHDLQTSVREMIRVTKPGGYILLISDPFMESVGTRAEKTAVELNVFDRHPMVLGGVNESFVPINFYLQELAEQADVVLLTMRIHNDPEFGNGPKYWNLSNETISHLGAKRGNLSSRFVVSNNSSAAEVCKKEEIPTRDFFETIGNPQQSVNFLLPYLSDDLFDTFPYQSREKFNLLNGWRANQDYDSPWREGYSRARLFLTRERVKNLALEVRNANADKSCELYWSLNGAKMGTLNPGQNPALIQFNSQSKLNDRNVVEIGIAGKTENKGAIWGQFNDSNSFLVRAQERIVMAKAS